MFSDAKQRVTWPSGDQDVAAGDIEERTRAGAMRILNIVTPECRLLSSRERCPYLVHLEVAETGLEGSDARLYASGAKGLGTTIEEALSIPKDPRAEIRGSSYSYEEGPPQFKIPSELLSTQAVAIEPSDCDGTDDEHHSSGLTDSMEQPDESDSPPGGGDANPQDGQGGKPTVSDVHFPSRGGVQYDESFFYPPDGADCRQQQYEQLHQQIQPPKVYQPRPDQLEERYVFRESCGMVHVSLGFLQPVSFHSNCTPR